MVGGNGGGIHSCHVGGGVGPGPGIHVVGGSGVGPGTGIHVVGGSGVGPGTGTHVVGGSGCGGGWMCLVICIPVVGSHGGIVDVGGM
jgi:hypothetical protein